MKNGPKPMSADLDSLRDRVGRLVEQNSSLDGKPLSELDSRDFLARLVDVVPTGVTVVDKEGGVIFANAQAEKILGLNRHDITARRYNTPDWKLTDYNGQHIPDDELPFSQVMTTGRSVSGMENAIEWPDGRRVYLRINGSPLINSYGGLDGVVFSLTDITEIQTMQNTLLSETEKLRKSNEELEQFAYIVSHDLQEPLRSVTGFLQLLGRRNPDLDEKSQHYIDKTRQAADRMQRLIIDLLKYSRVTTRGQEPEAVDAQEQLDRVVEDMAQSIEQTGATITSDELPMVKGDAFQLGRVFANLLTNAIKYHGEDPPRIHVGVEDKGRMWKFMVKDNGLGIDPIYFNRIFLIFKRLHGSDKFSGTGLGLALCRKVVEHHGGRIWVDSTPGKGSDFSFTMPKIEEEG